MPLKQMAAFSNQVAIYQCTYNRSELYTFKAFEADEEK